MKQPYNLNIAAGQTAILWNDGKVLIQKAYKEDSRIYTAWDSFVGTDEEVQAKIAELKLTSYASPKAKHAFGSGTSPAPSNPTA